MNTGTGKYDWNDDGKGGMLCASFNVMNERQATGCDMSKVSRHISGITADQELVERDRRRREGLVVTTQHTGQDHFTSQSEVRKWFSQTFHEWLLWDHGLSDQTCQYHFWLPRTKEQAALLKLRFG